MSDMPPPRLMPPNISDLLIRTAIPVASGPRRAGVSQCSIHDRLG